MSLRKKLIYSNREIYFPLFTYRITTITIRKGVADCMRVLTGAQMKQVEENSLAFDLTYHRLMENAGGAAAAFIRRTFAVTGLKALVFCARGNNGGDGMVVARKLAEAGAFVAVVLLDGTPQSPEAGAMYSTIRMMDVPIYDFTVDNAQVMELVEETDIIVDAICGTGFHGELRDAHRGACMAINTAIAAVISLDIPTGVTCDTAEADPDAVRADFTLAFDSRKPAHILPAAFPFCGQVEVLDIGIPPEAHRGVLPLFGMMETAHVFQELLPRPADSNKGDFGRVLNIAGCASYRGAAVLSTLAALRCGAGLVTLASIEEVCAAVACHAPEATLLPLARSAVGGIDFEGSTAALTGELARADSVVLGCGLGNSTHTARLLEHVLENAACPVIVDADGINALAGNIHVLQKASTAVILTPHPGEMARLCGVTTKEIAQDRQGYAMRFAREHKVTLVLKGAGTLTASPEGGLLLNQTGNPGLAKGGSGDVLAGMIGALLAQGLSPSRAAACAVHLHGLAADKTAARRSQYAMLPSELLEELCGVFLEQGR